MSGSLLMSAAGSTTLRASMIAVGYLTAVDENEGVPYFFAILFALLIVSWQAERWSLNGWREYQNSRGNG
ncbi:hypothetical protein [Rhodococcus phage REQ1]|uniref:hypothetical protein n=1 Tax=Rhodococcus phage REQ1 TaxID=1109712 RepID=UPI00023EEC50|nr:hypothetical protein RoPhREQ1_gp46 [Rhodococcus phage REQ1]AEV52042.1 hypothetical protein [Rhodococcus phage REQ1]